MRNCSCRDAHGCIPLINRTYHVSLSRGRACGSASGEPYVYWRLCRRGGRRHLRLGVDSRAFRVLEMTALSHARRPHYVLTFAVLMLAALAFALLQSMVAPALPEMQQALQHLAHGRQLDPHGLPAHGLGRDAHRRAAGRHVRQGARARRRARGARRGHDHLGALDVHRPDARRTRHPGHRRRRLPARHRHRARRVSQGARRHRHRADLGHVRRGRRHRHHRWPARSCSTSTTTTSSGSRSSPCCSRSSRPGCSCPSPPCAARAASTGWERRCCRAG